MNRIKDLRISLNNQPLRRKLVLLFASAACLIALVSIMGTRMVIHSYDQLVYERTADTLASVSDRITAALQSIVQASEYLATHNQLQDDIVTLMEETDPMQRAPAYSRLTSLLTNYASANHYIQRISLQCEDVQIDVGRYSQREPLPVWTAAAETAYAANGKAVLASTQREDSSLLCVRTVRRIENLNLSVLGVLAIRIDLQQIMLDSSHNTMHGASLYLVEHDALVYPVDDRSFASLLPEIDWDEPYQILSLDGQQLFAVGLYNSRLGWRTIVTAPYSDIFYTIRRANILFLVLTLCTLLLTISAMYPLVGNLLIHLSTLQAKIAAFRNGDAPSTSTQYDYAHRNDEIAVVHREFDAMQQQILSLIEDNYVKQLLIKDTRLKALQQQINPHFLYNTLNTINWEAKAEGNMQISRMAEALGALLLSALDEQTETVELHRELDLLGQYIYIQKIRYEQRLDYVQSVDETLLEMSVPKLCIQPLIENAIKYAVERQIGACCITVSIYREATHMCIRVDNTGSELETDLLRRLYSGEIQPLGNGIGLVNIDARIKLIYGDAYGLQINQANEAASVSLILPLMPQKGVRACTS